MNPSMSTKRLTISLCILLGIGGLFFGLTTPDNLPVALLMVPIILAFLVTTTIALLLMRLFSEGKQTKQRHKSYATLLGVVVAFLLVFQSTGGVVAGDLVLLGLIVLVSYVYISRY